MPEYVSQSGKWVLKVQEAPKAPDTTIPKVSVLEPKLTPEVKKVEKPVTKSKPKSKKKGR